MDIKWKTALYLIALLFGICAFFRFVLPANGATYDYFFAQKQSNVRWFIARVADIYGVSESTALYVAEHESQYDPKRIGDKGCSYGLWQINLCVHHDITKAQALSVVDSTLWAMPHLLAEPNIWSVYKYSLVLNLWYNDAQ